MCLIIFSYHQHPDYRLILAANRDEFYDRPTSPLALWDDAPAVLAGRDLKGEGTWLGITKTGRIAAITNFREPPPVDPTAPSRGLLVSDYLKGTEAPKTYLKHVKTIGYRYNGFNLLIGDKNELYYYSNKTEKIKELKPGLYGLSNHLLDTPWPKVEKGKEGLKKLVAGEKPINAEDIFRLLADRTVAPDSKLPDTGIDLNWERILSPVFITSDIYGTRSSSLILIDRNHEASFTERSFIPQKTGSLKQKTRKFSLKLSDTV
ncbi:MAG: NRDE family protein [Thermodesulfobacteriota bacterium]|nr:NRDE family protein [Thermodesulfobacteriota bacterium]